MPAHEARPMCASPVSATSQNAGREEEATRCQDPKSPRKSPRHRQSRGGAPVLSRPARLARASPCTVNLCSTCAATSSGAFFRWGPSRSEEHTSELQSLMRISYAVFCSKKKNTKNNARKQLRSKATKKKQSNLVAAV